MMRFMSVLLLAGVSLAGVAVGSLSTNVSTTRAVSDYELYVNPGGSTNYLSCGWHSTCLFPFPDGDALDWGNDPYTNNQVYFRAWGVKGYSGLVKIANGYVGRRDTMVCYQAVTDVVSLYGAYVGRTHYLHTLFTGSEGASFSIYGRDTGYFQTYGSFGVTVDGELTTSCPRGDDGPHLHQYSALGGTWTKNTGVYPAAPEEGTGYPLGDWNSWQNRTYWTE